MQKLFLISAAIGAFFSPISLMIIILMVIILIDTIVKLVSIWKMAKKSGRPFRDVFRSQLLRKGFIFKSFGYLALALPVYLLDFYMLTPFLHGALIQLGYDFSIPTSAVFTNLLLAVFCLMEISSINENWFDITGNNMLKRASDKIKKIRSAIQSTTEFVDETKQKNL